MWTEKSVVYAGTLNYKKKSPIINVCVEHIITFINQHKKKSDILTYRETPNGFDFTVTYKDNAHYETFRRLVLNRFKIYKLELKKSTLGEDVYSIDSNTVIQLNRSNRSCLIILLILISLSILLIALQLYHEMYMYNFFDIT